MRILSGRKWSHLTCDMLSLNLTHTRFVVDDVDLELKDA